MSHFAEVEETELNAVEEAEDRMSDQYGDGVEGGGELSPPDWRVRAGLRNKQRRKKRRTRSNTRAIQILVHALHYGRGCTHREGPRL